MRDRRISTCDSLRIEAGAGILNRGTLNAQGNARLATEKDGVGVDCLR